MANNVQETYGAIPFAANASSALIGTAGGSLGGFLCTTSGSLKITMTNAAGAVIVDTVPVTAGVFLPIPLQWQSSAVLWAILTGGAAGTFFVN